MGLPSTQTSTGSKRQPETSMAKPKPHTEAAAAPEPPKAVKVHNLEYLRNVNYNKKIMH